jgi:argininosuccinate synthase
MREKVVLAYSGGLDTSIIIPWLKENYDCDVIAYVADVGQGDDTDAVVEKAYKTGASKVIVEDLRQEFLTDYVFPAIQAGAVYEHKYLLGTDHVDLDEISAASAGQGRNSFDRVQRRRTGRGQRRRARSSGGD